jgi:purine-nucleoside phosphorylase
MQTFPDPLLFERAAAALPSCFREGETGCGLILGSGWSAALDGGETLARLSYDAIPGLGASTVAGHAGELRLLRWEGMRLAAFCGRRHWYEGSGWTPVVLPVELLRRLGVRRLLLTNAAGGINPSLRPGSLLLIRDHLNMTGLSPLQGPVLPGWGTRFPDQSAVYAPGLAASLRACARRQGVGLAEGTYVFTPGPAYETPAEIRVCASWGADVVGMSTVPEAMVANAMGMRVAALSCVTNMAAGVGEARLSHEEVLAAAREAAPRLRRLLAAILSDWAAEERGRGDAANRG